MYRIPADARVIISVVIAACLLAQVSCSDQMDSDQKTSERYLYVDASGTYLAVIPGERVVKVYGSADELSGHSDVGGTFENCTDQEFYCVLMNSIPLTIPKEGNKLSWSRGDTTFSVVGDYRRQVIVIEALRDRQRLVRYGYRKEQGLIWMSFVPNNGTGEEFGPFEVEGKALWGEAAGSWLPSETAVAH